jgi:predicted transcriptional regulator
MVMEVHGNIDGVDEIGLTESDVHRLLAADRRRLALDVLSERGSMGLGELAEAVVEREGEAREPPFDAVRRTKVDLYHRHLPLMADMGVVSFDPMTEFVAECRISVEAP